MKKLLTLLLLCTSVLFFSCETTKKTVAQSDEQTEENAVVQEGAPAQENAVAEENPTEESLAENSAEGVIESSQPIDSKIEEYKPNIKVGWIDPEEKNPEEKTSSENAEVSEEKIPQEELEEMEVLLAENAEDVKEKAVEEKPAEEAKPAPEKPVVLAVVPPVEEPKTSEAVPEKKPEEKKPSVNTTSSTPAKPAATESPSNQAATPVPEKSEDIAQAYNFVDYNPEVDPETEIPTEEEKEPEPIVPSRTINVKRNQYVDIVYPGTGWIYLGEETVGDHFIFHGRKVEGGESIFTLRSKRPGNSILHFYKNDVLTGKYIDDYIEINVAEENAFDTTHITAPSYAQVVPPKYQRPTEEELEQKQAKPLIQKKEEASNEKSAAESKPQETPSSSAPANLPKQDEPVVASTTSEKVQTVIQTSESSQTENSKPTVIAGTENSVSEGVQAESAVPEDLAQGGGSAKTLLERAQKAYDEKRYPEALTLVRQFFEVATEDFDAGLYLEGRILEARSEVQNIKAAINDYDVLIKNWPQSIYWNRANERSIYLKRFYIDIR